MTLTPIHDDVTALTRGASPNAYSRERDAAHSLRPVIAEPGERLPDFELTDATGTAVRLSAARGGGAAVLILYRGAWCPFCNIALRVYRDQLNPALAARGITLIAVSPQSPDGSLTMAEKHGLEFPVLSDTGNRIAAHLGVLTAPSDEARAAQLAAGLDLASVNADGTTALPMPTTAILDADGVLRWIDVHPDYATRTEPAEILAAVDALRGNGGLTDAEPAA